MTTPQPADESTARGDLAEALLPEAAFLAMAVRDRDPADIAQRLAGLTRHELEALAVVLAAMVDPDRSTADALDWIDFDEQGRALETPPRSPRGAIRDLARDPERAATGPCYATAIRSLEGERLRLRGIDRTLAVRVGVTRGMSYADVACELGMDEDAVRRSWERIKRRAREDGLPVPQRPPGRGEVAS